MSGKGSKVSSDHNTMGAIAAAHPEDHARHSSIHKNREKKALIPDVGVEEFRNGNMKTQGEKSFDNWFYWANNFGLNLLISAPITYFFIKNKNGQGIYRSMLKSFETMGVKNPDTRKVMANALSLTTGGHFTAAGVKVAEDNKYEIVDWLDRGHYGDQLVDTSPEIQAAHERIALESSPTWLNMIASRAVCSASVTAAAGFAGREDSNMLMNYGKSKNIPALRNFTIEGMGRVAGQKTADLTPAAMQKAFNTVLSPLATENKHLVYRDVLTYGAMDVVYTFLTAVILKPVLAGFSLLPGMRHYPSRDKYLAQKEAEESKSLNKQATPHRSGHPHACPSCPACDSKDKPMAHNDTGKLDESGIILPQSHIEKATPQGLVHPYTGQQITAG